MTKQEILKELQIAYSYLTQDPEKWAKEETEKVHKKGYNYSMETSDFYPSAKGYAEASIEYILKKCGMK